MNKNRLVLPIAALLMVPCFIGCSTGDVYQASFNNDQVICTHGEQIVDISLTGKTKSMLHFKDVLTTSMFKLPDEYKDKKIEAVYPYNKGSSLYILFSKDVALPEGKDSVDLEITVSKDAFKEKALDSKFTVSLFANQIRYAGYTYSTITEDDVFHFEATIEMIGADALIPQHSELENGKCAGYFALTATKEDVVSGKGSVDFYELEENKYFIAVEHQVTGVTDDTKFTLCFDGKSTTLHDHEGTGGEYHCDIEADGNPSKDHFLFEKK